MFIRRLGADPHLNGDTSGAQGCPDVWELEDGTFAVIGMRKTSGLIGSLPASAGCGPDEEIVVLPRHVMIGLKKDIPSE